METHMTNTNIDLVQPAAAQSTPATRQGEPVKVMIVTDAWEPQVNGVVRTLTHARLYEVLKNRDLSNLHEIVTGSYFGEVPKHPSDKK